MNEFKTIPNAPEYKINSEKEVRRISNDKPVFVLAGGKVLLKTSDGGMDHFIVEDLVKELFNNNIDVEQIITNKTNNSNPMITNETNPTESEKEITQDVNGLTPSVKKGRGRPKKLVDPNAPVKVKGTGKRGRPAGSKNKAK